MVVLVVVLVLTNLLTLSLLLAERWAAGRAPADDGSTEVFTAPRPATVTGRSRRLISIEILNPIELAATRGRVLGFAGSVAPGLVGRVVYDQTLKTLRRELREQQVAADVRLHVLRRVPSAPAVAAPETAEEIELEPVSVTPEDVTAAKRRPAASPEPATPREPAAPPEPAQGPPPVS